MRVDAKGNKLDSDVVSEIITEAVVISKGDRDGEISVEFTDEYLTSDLEGVEELISAFNTAISLGWLECKLKEVK